MAYIGDLFNSISLTNISDVTPTGILHIGGSPYHFQYQEPFASNNSARSNWFNNSPQPVITVSIDRKSTRLNSSHTDISRMPPSA